MSSEIHSIAFDNTKWNTTTAKKWLKEHNYKPIKRVHKTTNTLRYRLLDPKLFKTFIVKKNKKDGINFIIGYY